MFHTLPHKLPAAKPALPKVEISYGPFFVTDDNAEFLTPEAAADHVESLGADGAVTKFFRSQNGYGGHDDRSSALWTFEAGKWLSRAIFSGSATPLGEERPGSNAVELRRLAAKPFVSEVLTPGGYWNPGDRFATRKAAEASNAKWAKKIGATYRVVDSRA